MTLWDAAQIMVRSRACSVSTHDVGMIRVQGETNRAIVGAAHGYFIATLEQVLVAASPIATIFGCRIQFRHVPKGTAVRVAPALFCTTFSKRRGVHVAIPFLAEDILGQWLNQPVVWAFVGCAIAFSHTTSVQVDV